MKYPVYLIFVFVLFSPSLFAQTNPQKDAEITIYSGLSFFEHERELSPCIICADLPVFFQSREAIEGSFLLGFKAGYYFNENFEIEGNFAIAPNHEFELEAGFVCRPGEICPLLDPGTRPGGPTAPTFFDRRNVVAYHYDANFVYNFSLFRIRPFLTFGVGGITSEFLNDGQTDFSFNFGAGTKFDFNGWGLRLEVNDHVIPDHFFSDDTEHDLQVQYGFLFRL